MRSLRFLVPSAGALIVFETAGRLQSFTAAGRELGMSQAAVSQAIRSLEAQLGVSLFRREHRKVVLTDAGRRFFADVTLGLSHIRKSAEELRSFATETHVTLAGSTAFASFWMMPKLQRIRNDLPDIELRLQSADRDLDLLTEGIPLGIRGGQPEDWPEYDCAFLAEEEIIAVAGTRYEEIAGLPNTPEELLSHRLIHLEEPYRDAIDWADWLASAGVQAPRPLRGLVINDYALVMQAAIEGQGIALGWTHLTEHMVGAGLLQRVTDHTLKTGKAFYVVWHKTRTLSDPAKQVRDWLLERA